MLNDGLSKYLRSRLLTHTIRIQPLPLHEIIDKSGCLIIMNRNQYSIHIFTLAPGLLATRHIHAAFITRVPMKGPSFWTTWKTSVTLTIPSIFWSFWPSAFWRETFRFLAYYRNLRKLYFYYQNDQWTYLFTAIKQYPTFGNGVFFLTKPTYVYTICRQPRKISNFVISFYWCWCL